MFNKLKWADSQEKDCRYNNMHSIILTIITWRENINNDSNIKTSNPSHDNLYRQAVLDGITDIQRINNLKPITYKMWARIVSDTDENPAIDCSGLICHIWRNAWFAVNSEYTTRVFFRKYNTEVLLEKGQTKASINLDNIKPWDLIYWNATNDAYDRSSEPIPNLMKDDKKYRIHHIALVKDIYPNTNEILIFESRYPEGVGERRLSIVHELENTESQSELYVSRIDYNKLTRKTQAE